MCVPSCALVRGPMKIVTIVSTHSPRVRSLVARININDHDRGARSRPTPVSRNFPHQCRAQRRRRRERVQFNSHIDCQINKRDDCAEEEMEYV